MIYVSKGCSGCRIVSRPQRVIMYAETMAVTQGKCDDGSDDSGNGR